MGPEENPVTPSTCVFNPHASTSAEAGAAAVYKALAKLSRTFKDQLAYPLIAAARAGRQKYKR